MEINYDDFIILIGKLSINDSGDSLEKNFYLQFLQTQFPNYEIFWKYFVIPATNRINNLKNSNSICIRSDVENTIKEITSIHYSIFMHLIFSALHLNNFTKYDKSFGFSPYNQNMITCSGQMALPIEFINQTQLLMQNEIKIELQKDPYSIEDFYIHLVSACELVINFIKKFYKFICRTTKKKISQSELKTLLDNLDGYNEFIDLLEEIKKYYRNQITHDIKIFRFIRNGVIYLPQRNENNLSKYIKTWPDENQLNPLDFIEAKLQLKNDLNKILIYINKLWNKPIEKIKNLIDNKDNNFFESLHIRFK